MTLRQSILGAAMLVPLLGPISLPQQMTVPEPPAIKVQEAYVKDLPANPMERYVLADRGSDVGRLQRALALEPFAYDAARKAAPKNAALIRDGILAIWMQESYADPRQRNDDPDAGVAGPNHITMQLAQHYGIKTVPRAADETGWMSPSGQVALDSLEQRCDGDYHCMAAADHRFRPSVNALVTADIITKALGNSADLRRGYRANRGGEAATQEEYAWRTRGFERLVRDPQAREDARERFERDNKVPFQTYLNEARAYFD